MSDASTRPNARRLSRAPLAACLANRDKFALDFYLKTVYTDFK